MDGRTERPVGARATSLLRSNTSLRVRTPFPVPSRERPGTDKKPFFKGDIMMKKAILALVLILCLAIAVFAFASCGKSGKTDATTAANTTAAPAAGTTAEPTAEPTAAETTATPTQPPHVHTPEDHYTIDLEPTCSTPGEQSYYCEECGEKIEGSTVSIPIDPDAHKIDSWNVTDPVNMFHVTGRREGVCQICDQTVVEELKFEPTIEAFTSASGQYNTEKVYYKDVRGEKHFYPTEEDPEGNDLLVEFSILWNESILDFNPASNCYMCGRFDKNGPFYYLSPVVGCPTSDAGGAGAFEWMGNFATPISDSEVTTPATMCGKSNNYADYPNINGTDPDHPEYGWHRIGIRYHFELLEGKPGAALADYRGTATVYIDGTAIFKLSTGDDGMQDKEAHLFNAERNGDTVTYSDVDSWIIPFQINRAQAKTDKTVYLALADFSVTCGKNFVMQVEKVASPEAATLTVADGVDIPAPIYFKLAD